MECAGKLRRESFHPQITQITQIHSTGAVKLNLRQIISHKKAQEAQNNLFRALDDLRPEGPGGNSHDRQVVDRDPMKASERRRCGTKR